LEMSSLLQSLVLAGVLAVASASSQWCNVASDATGQKLVAVGYGCKQVLISDDFGVTWQYTKAPSQAWGSLYSDSTGQKLIVGPKLDGTYTTKYGTMVSNDRGLTWTTATYNMDASTNYVLEDKISASSNGQRLLTVQMGNKLTKSADGGASWFGVDNVPYNKTMDVNGYGSAISGTGTIWYAVNDVQELYVSKNTGTTWAKAHDRLPSSTWENFVTDNTGQYLFATTHYGFYASSDYGTTMSTIHSWSGGTNSYVVDLSTDPAAKYVYVMASDGLWVYTRSTGTFVKNPNLTIAVSQGYTGYSVDASDNGQHIIASVQPNGLYHSDDFGTTWVYTSGL